MDLQLICIEENAKFKGEYPSYCLLPQRVKLLSQTVAVINGTPATISYRFPQPLQARPFSPRVSCGEWQAGHCNKVSKLIRRLRRVCDKIARAAPSPRRPNFALKDVCMCVVCSNSGGNQLASTSGLTTRNGISLDQ